MSGPYTEEPTMGPHTDPRYDEAVSRGVAIRCPACQWVSFHPDDIANGWCGHCRMYTSDGRTTHVITLEELIQEKINDHRHSEDIKVIEASGYEPFVKLVCSTCGGETYVRRPEGEKAAQA